MPELALDDQERNSFAGDLDGVRVPNLMGREPAPHPGCLSGAAQLRSQARRRAWSSACRAAQRAGQSADRQRRTVSEPWDELLPGPAIHSDLAPLAAFPAPDEDGTARLIEIGLNQRQRLADPETGAPQHNDQAPEPETVGIITGSAHHGDNLLNVGGSGG
jgi:hypothetical protein